MTFFRLENNRLINIRQIESVHPPNHSTTCYQLVMVTGRVINLLDREAETLLQLITIYSIPVAELELVD